MSDQIICNALIEGAQIRLDRGAFLCAWIDLDYGDSSHQGFGGHVLGADKSCAAGDHRNMPNYAAEALVKIMQCCGVEQWKDIPGKAVRVKRSCAGMSGDVIAIGHITKDVWYEPKKDFNGWARL